MEGKKQHWEGIYKEKQDNEVSWYEAVPETSLSLIEQLPLSADSPMIDIGGGDSFLTEILMRKGYHNLSVLDISSEVLKRARERMGGQGRQIHWIASDVLDLDREAAYMLWHDRAAFHFLTDKEEQIRYLHILEKAVAPSGFVILSTFAEDGPKKCSGLPVQQYSEEKMTAFLSPAFEKITCLKKTHHTPFRTEQRFLYGCFRRVG